MLRSAENEVGPHYKTAQNLPQLLLQLLLLLLSHWTQHKCYTVLWNHKGDFGHSSGMCWRVKCVFSLHTHRLLVCECVSVFNFQFRERHTTKQSWMCSTQCYVPTAKTLKHFNKEDKEERKEGKGQLGGYYMAFLEGRGITSRWLKAGSRALLQNFIICITKLAGSVSSVWGNLKYCSSPQM